MCDVLLSDVGRWSVHLLKIIQVASHRDVVICSATLKRCDVSSSLSHSRRGPLHHPRMTSSDSISPHIREQMMVVVVNLVQPLLVRTAGTIFFYVCLVQRVGSAKRILYSLSCRWPSVKAVRMQSLVDLMWFVSFYHWTGSIFIMFINWCITCVA